MNLGLHLHQLHSQHMPSASAMSAWCAHGVCLVRSRCLSGAHAMPIWLARGAHMVQGLPIRRISLSLSQEASYQMADKESKTTWRSKNEPLIIA